MACVVHRVELVRVSTGSARSSSNPRSLRRVAFTHSVGVRMFGQRAAHVVCGAASGSEAEEASLAVALGVSVGRSGAEAPLLAAVTNEAVLGDDGEEEEEDGHDANGKTRRLHLARLPQVRHRYRPALPVIHPPRVRVAGSKGRINRPRARARASAVRRGNIDERPREADIETHRQQRRDGVPGRAAQHQKTQDRVENGATGNTLNGPDPVVDVEAMAVERRQKVGKQGKNDGRAAKLHGAEKELETPESQARAGAHDGMVQAKR